MKRERYRSLIAGAIMAQTLERECLFSGLYYEGMSEGRRLQMFGRGGRAGSGRLS